MGGVWTQGGGTSSFHFFCSNACLPTPPTPLTSHATHPVSLSEAMPHTPNTSQNPCTTNTPLSKVRPFASHPFHKRYQGNEVWGAAHDRDMDVPSDKPCGIHHIALTSRSTLTASESHAVANIYLLQATSHTPYPSVPAHTRARVKRTNKQTSGCALPCQAIAIKKLHEWVSFCNSRSMADCLVI